MTMQRRIATNKFLLQKKRLSDRTKHAYVDKLRKCIKSAFEENIIPTNPMKDVKNYSNAGKTPVCLTWD